MHLKHVSVKIVGFEMQGDNGVNLTYRFSNGKKVQRLTNLEEARKKQNRVGQYIQIPITDADYEAIFGKPPPIFYNGVMLSPVVKKKVEEEEEEIKPEPVVEYEEDQQIGLFD